MDAPDTRVSPRGISLFQLLGARRDPLAFLDNIARWPGDISHARFGRQTAVLLKHPDLVQQLLVAESGKIAKGRTLERALFFVFLGDSLLNSEGAAHRRQRRLMLPGFHRTRIAGYSTAMVRAATTAMEPWRDGETRDIVGDIMGLTLSVVGHTLFSADVDDTAGKIVTSFSELTEHVKRLALPGAKWLLKSPMPFARRLRRARATLDEVVYALIRARRARGEDTGDLLSMLLLAEDAERPGERLNETEIRDQVMTLFFAGHETTANVLTWTLWLLAEHPAVAAALDTELRQVLGDRPPAFADVPQLVVTDQIVTEVLRLYPPIWAMGRKALVDLDFGGHHVPAGSLLVASQWKMHRDERWFPDANSFRPERWTPAFRTALPRFAYFPFGGGPRSCLGENFAWTELVLILATLAQRWRFESTPASRQVRPEARITLHPNQAVPLRLHRRL